MKVFVAGATGAVGVPLIGALVAGGHEVLGLTRDGGKAARLTSLGATPVVADALDRDALLRAVDGHDADAVVHELTALTKPPTRHAGMEPTDRLRVEGTTNLLAAAEVLGARRFVTQSIIFGYGFADHGDTVLTEDSPFGELPGTKSDPHIAAMLSTEQQAFTAPEGVALRYGMFYGRDMAAMRPALAKRAIPVTKGGTIGWVHHDDAVDATIAALERGRPGEAYNVVDDLPATWAEVFTAMAAAVGAPKPRQVPRWMLRLMAPYVAEFVIGTTMRVSNAKAKRELRWTPRYPTFREGMAALHEASGSVLA